MQAAGVTLLPLESPLNTRVFEVDFEGVGYVYLFFSFREQKRHAFAALVRSFLSGNILAPPQNSFACRKRVCREAPPLRLHMVTAQKALTSNIRLL